MENSIIEKPCLVETPQGFSVSYKNKLLYSKYSPQKAILQKIQELNLLPGTLILCYSGVLEYGFQELQNKLPENCFILRCEFDKELYDFTVENSKANIIPLLSIDELYNLPVLLHKKNVMLECGAKLPAPGTFRRVLAVDFSAGTSFHTEIYNQLTQACTSSIMTFWTNRLTLTKFGRRYSYNFFSNLKRLNKTKPIENFFNSVSKPIIVCGAGESLDSGISDFSSKRNEYFIICADTSLKTLNEHNIIPDAVFIEEAQQVISKAFIGTSNTKTHFFASLSSIPQLYDISNKNNISYFTTQFADTDFINKLNENSLLPHINQPFGSVGLTAVYYALKFRQDINIPVYVYGLDFSYSVGKTHAKGTLAHKNRLLQTFRLLPVQNYGSSFNKTSFTVPSKDGTTFYSTPVLKSYADMFNRLFEKEPNLFDAGKCGINLSIEKKTPELTDLKLDENIIIINKDYSNLKNYLNQEKDELILLRNILSGAKKIPAEKMEVTILDLLKSKEYLYLHFADGWKFQYNQSFLNRIRTEIDFFLKVF